MEICSLTQNVLECGGRLYVYMCAVVLLSLREPVKDLDLQTKDIFSWPTEVISATSQKYLNCIEIKAMIKIYVMYTTYKTWYTRVHTIKQGSTIKEDMVEERTCKIRIRLSLDPRLDPACKEDEESYTGKIRPLNTSVSLLFWTAFPMCICIKNYRCAVSDVIKSSGICTDYYLKCLSRYEKNRWSK